MHVHQHDGQLSRASWVVHFALSDVDESLREPVAVVDVVAAAAPHPITWQTTWSEAPPTTARAQFAVATRSRHGVNDTG